MTHGYQLALFVHLLALMAAVAASAVVQLAAHRRDRARTVREALEWHGLAGRTSITFPLALLVLVATGAYMAMQGGASAWRAGFVSAGFLGAILIFAIGLVLKAKGGRLAALLVQRIQRGEGEQAPRLPEDRVATRLVGANNGLVFGVVLDMTLKPSPAVAMATLAICVAIGAAIATRQSGTATAAEAADDAKARVA